MPPVIGFSFLRGPFWAYEWFLLEGKFIQTERAKKVSLCSSWNCLANGGDPIPIRKDGCS